MKAKTTKQWFKTWSNEYDKTLGKVGKHHRMLELAVEMSRVQDGNRILDIGCGTGLLSLAFLKAAACHVTGVDSSKEMLNIWKDKIVKLKLQDSVECTLNDAAHMGFKDRTFDVVASTVTLHHLKSKHNVIRKIYNVLKPGGVFILGDLDVDTSGNLNDIKRLQRIMDYLKEELAFALKDGGVTAFSRMYDNGKKHILNDGEYCISFKQWAHLCRKAGFKKIVVKPVKSFTWLKVLKCERRD